MFLDLLCSMTYNFLNVDHIPMLKCMHKYDKIGRNGSGFQVLLANFSTFFVKLILRFLWIVKQVALAL